VSNSTGHIVAATGLFTHPDGRVLMVRTHIRGWEFPGGQVEPGEAVLDGLLREVIEEAGIRVEVDALAGVYTNAQNPPKLILQYIGRAVSFELATSEETPESAWVERASVLERITHPVIRLRAQDALEYNGGVIHRVYTSPPFQLLQTTHINHHHQS